MGTDDVEKIIAPRRKASFDNSEFYQSCLHKYWEEFHPELLAERQLKEGAHALETSTLDGRYWTKKFKKN